ncbi:hypothetical protein KR067_005147, partial [Drosophila pandora]
APPKEPRGDSEFNYLITGGYTTDDTSLVKFAVFVTYKEFGAQFGDNIIGGGVIIHKQFVLTAAHVVKIGGELRQPGDLKVVGGTPKRLLMTTYTTNVKVKQFFIHPDYRGRNHDLALLLLEWELTLTSNVAVVQVTRNPPHDGMECTVVGWGAVVDQGPIADKFLNGALRIKQSACANLPRWESSGMLCAHDPNFFEVDSCLYDSGSPLFCGGDTLYGIVAFGLACGNPSHGGAYMDLYYHRNFLSE